MKYGRKERGYDAKDLTIRLTNQTYSLIYGPRGYPHLHPITFLQV